MKKILVAILMFLPMTAIANIVEVDGVYFSLNLENKTAAVSAGETKYTGDVVIPKSVVCDEVSYEVEGIEASAFILCTGLSSITLPETIKTIGSRAFSGCTKLSKVFLNEGLERIGKWAHPDLSVADLHRPCMTA